MPSFPQEPYSTLFLHECGTLSNDNTDTFKLMKLKKEQLKMICVHHNLNIKGVKDKLVERIVAKRDTLFRVNLEEWSIENIQFHLIPFGRYITYEPHTPWRSSVWFISDLSKTKSSDVIKVNIRNENGEVIITNYPYKQETFKNFPKINLVLYLRRIRQLTKNRPNISPREIKVTYDTYSKSEIIEKIKKSLIKLEKEQSKEPKCVKINNLSGIRYDLYWTYIRNDYPDYSDCRYLGIINSNGTFPIKYTNDNTNIIVVKARNDGIAHSQRCYLMEIKDYIILNKNVKEKNIYNFIYIKNTTLQELEMWKKTALKCDFLLKELKRLGCEEHDTYGCILDLHQDIDIPNHTERDKDIAGIPSAFTNLT